MERRCEREASWQRKSPLSGKISPFFRSWVVFQSLQQYVFFMTKLKFDWQYAYLCRWTHGWRGWRPLTRRVRTQKLNNQACTTPFEEKKSKEICLPQIRYLREKTIKTERKKIEKQWENTVNRDFNDLFFFSELIRFRLKQLYLVHFAC